MSKDEGIGTEAASASDRLEHALANAVQRLVCHVQFADQQAVSAHMRREHLLTARLAALQSEELLTQMIDHL